MVLAQQLGDEAAGVAGDTEDHHRFVGGAAHGCFSSECRFTIGSIVGWTPAASRPAWPDAAFSLRDGQSTAIGNERQEGYRQGEHFVAQVTELIDFGGLRAMLIEVPMRVMHEYARTPRPGSIADARIELAYPAPREADTYARWFQCPVVFGAARRAGLSAPLA